MDNVVDRSGPPQRSLRRRLRFDLEVDRLRQDLEALPSRPNPPYLPLGHVLAVGGTTPATLSMANVNGDEKVFKSMDGG